MILEDERKAVKRDINATITRYYDSKSPISCKSNCSSCCHVPVTCFTEEIDDILSLDINIDFKRLESQINNWSASDKTCIFIKDGNCSIHDNKPMSCISHLVNTNPVNCGENSTKSPNRIQVRSVNERLKKLRIENKTVILHKEIYKRLTSI